jgi:hypothetical protein
MADKKISALPASTTPLAGTEVLPIVQGGATVQVSAANITAGRAVTALSATTTGGLKNISSGSDSESPTQGLFFTDAANKNVIVQLGASGGLSSFVYEAGGAGWRRVAGLLVNGNSVVDVGNVVIGTTAKGITTGSAIPLGFGVNNTVTAMTIDTSSNVGIGTTTPTSKLDVNGAINLSGVPYLATDGTSNYLKIGPAGTYIQNSAGSTTFGIITNAGNLGLGTSSPAATALLDVQSTTKGVRFPNMTTTQKNAITPSAGTVVFDTTLAKLCVYSGAAWQTITSV